MTRRRTEAVAVSIGAAPVGRGDGFEFRGARRLRAARGGSSCRIARRRGAVRRTRARAGQYRGAHLLPALVSVVDELARLALSVMAFVGGAVAYRRREHAHVRLILAMLPARGKRFCLALADVVVLFATGLTGVVSTEFIASNWSERTPILQLPASLIAMPLPLGMTLIMVFAADRLRRTHGKAALPTAAAFVLVAGAAAATCGQRLPVIGPDAPILAALVLFVLAILAGVPVGFVLLIATTAYLWGSGAASLAVLPQNMVNGTGNYILLAIPFFILAGLVMERGGVSLRLKHRPSQTPEGPYELTEGAGGAANLNREMIRLLDFAEQLEQAGESILSLRRGREMRLIVHLVRHYLSGQLTTTSSLAAASGLSYGAAMRTIGRMKSRGLIVERTRTATGKSFSVHATAKLLGQWQEYASQCRILVGSAQPSVSTSMISKAR